ncbi:hypothetical protein, partial [Ralstonia mannitolilytica]|uniref:hypothetical protein n=1 Tax=Ralstonia mannitolilytica TaxID=105219 RepID=UPI001F457DF2
TGLPSLSFPQQKSKAPSRAQRQKKKGQPIARLAFVVWAGAQMVRLLSFDFPALDGALNFCCREEKGRETV